MPETESACKARVHVTATHVLQDKQHYAIPETLQANSLEPTFAEFIIPRKEAPPPFKKPRRMANTGLNYRLRDVMATRNNIVQTWSADEPETNKSKLGPS